MSNPVLLWSSYSPRAAFSENSKGYIVYYIIIIATSKDGETIIHNDMTYSLRHVEESWIHLLKAGKHLRE